PPRGANTPAARRSLIMQNLRCVLVATVRGARGSCVLLLIGLTTPSCADVTGRQHHFHPPGWAPAPMKTLADSSSALYEHPMRPPPILRRVYRRQSLQPRRITRLKYAGSGD